MQLESLLHQAQLQALRSQLNPHFLFNALHSIAELVHEDPKLAEQLIVRLGELLRQVLQSSDVAGSHARRGARLHPRLRRNRADATRRAPARHLGRGMPDAARRAGAEPDPAATGRKRDSARHRGRAAPGTLTIRARREGSTFCYSRCATPARACRAGQHSPAAGHRPLQHARCACSGCTANARSSSCSRRRPRRELRIPLARAMTLNVLIVDDEPMARKRLQRLLRANPICACCRLAPMDAVPWLPIHEQRPDLVFLDVQMPGDERLRSAGGRRRETDAGGDLRDRPRPVRAAGVRRRRRSTIY